MLPSNPFTLITHSLLSPSNHFESPYAVQAIPPSTSANTRPPSCRQSVAVSSHSLLAGASTASIATTGRVVGSIALPVVVIGATIRVGVIVAAIVIGVMIGVTVVGVARGAVVTRIVVVAL